jgi:signal peptidase I
MGDHSVPAKQTRLGVLRVAIGLVVFLLTVQCFFMCTVVSGTSMFPTLQNGQFTLVSTLAYLFGQPKRGDLVVVSTGNELLIKRIVGLPGEKFAIRDSRAVLDGKYLVELYLNRGGHWQVAEGRIGEGKYVVVGDNRSGLQGDSLLALVKKERILGKVIYY